MWLVLNERRENAPDNEAHSLIKTCGAMKIDKTGFLFFWDTRYIAMYASVIGTVRVRYCFTVRRSDFDPPPPKNNTSSYNTYTHGTVSHTHTHTHTHTHKKTIVYCATHTITILSQPHCTNTLICMIYLLI